jgi:hypothetical protein
MPQLFSPWILNSRRCLHFCPRSGRFRLYELRVSRTFLDFLRLICSVHGYPTQGAANTSCPSSDRFRLRELRESQHFSTFYGPSVQSMDTQLGARQRGADPGERGAWGVGRGAWSEMPAGRDLIRESAEVADDAQVPAIRRCFIHGRVRYIEGKSQFRHHRQNCTPVHIDRAKLMGNSVVTAT